MRTKILILACVLSVSIMKAQERDYDYYIHQIDSLQHVFSDERIPIYSESIVTRDFLSNCDLTFAEKKQIVSKVEKFYENENPLMLYYLAETLLGYMYSAFKEEEIRQSIIYILIDKTFYTNTECNCWQNSIVSNYNTDSTKARLKELMQNKLTEKEKNVQYRKYETIYKKGDMKFRETKVKKIMETTKRSGEGVYNFLMDSLKFAYINESINDVFFAEDYLPVSNNCIYIIGRTEDKSFISYLETYREKYSKVSGIERACTFALAKLGIQKYKDIIYKYRNFSWDDMKYLGTEEALWHYIDNNFTWNKSTQFMIPGPSIPKAMMLISAMESIITNIPKELKLNITELETYAYRKDRINDYTNYNPQDDIEYKAIQQTLVLYQWLLDNKGKLDIFN